MGTRSGQIAPHRIAPVPRKPPGANPVGHGTHCMQPVAWVGRWKFLKGWTKVWSCERHADELVGARLY